MEKKRIGVIGVGHLGAIHARLYSKMADVELVGVCDINKSAAKRVAKACGTKPHCSYKELLNKIDAASIVVPTGAHHSISKDFLEHGVHLLIEKPITGTVEEADELLKIANRKNLILQVGHIERFNPTIRALKPILKRPKLIVCERLGPFKRRAANVGVITDLMIHDIDIALYLVQSEVASIDAIGINVLSDYEDIANARIRFKNGTLCSLTASRITNKEVRKIRIFQEDAYISLDCLKKTAYIYRKKHKKIIRTNLRIKKFNALEEELLSFIECIRTTNQPLVSGKDGKAALALAIEIAKKMEKR